ncbi:MAG: fused MFS/spermidine synthase [Candidatus Absconditabacteria bacterium]
MKFKYLLEFVVFSCGAIVMIFELAGSRVLGPYFGSSIFVWSSLIGIVLLSLSIGYYYGGQEADKRASISRLSSIVFLSGILILVMLVGKEYVLKFFLDFFVDIKYGVLFSVIVLFLPASIFLGMVTPFAFKLKLQNIEDSGKTAGSLYAMSTFGSIFGTFLCGFYLIPTFGTNNILLFISAVLILLSIMIGGKVYLKTKIFVLLWIVLVYFYLRYNSQVANYLDFDTQYSRVFIYNYVDSKTGKDARVMGINNENHSSMFLDSDELVNEYTKYYSLIEHFTPGFRNVLMIGGAGYSFPKYFLQKYENAKIKVVEIDPKITQLATKYFRLEPNKNLEIIHQDGRVYLNKSQEKFDAILGDAFTSKYSVPYQLTTLQAVQKQYDMLNDNGVVVLNIISGFQGPKSLFLQAEYSTFKKVFPQVYLFQVREESEYNLQNAILVALKSKEKVTLTNTDVKLQQLLNRYRTGTIENSNNILTDDFAPVDNYIQKALF